MTACNGTGPLGSDSMVCVLVAHPLTPRGHSFVGTGGGVDAEASGDSGD